MRRFRGLRPLKQWRWVGCFADEIFICAAHFSLAGLAQKWWWTVWDRNTRQSFSNAGRSKVPFELGVGRLSLDSAQMVIDLRWQEDSGIEASSRQGEPYTWTRKQAGANCDGLVRVNGMALDFSGSVIVDDSAGYHDRSTKWQWCAGVGRLDGGEVAAWNLVEGIHDSCFNSERTLWVDGAPSEVSAVTFTPFQSVSSSEGLQLTFASETSYKMRENFLIISSDYEQQLGCFAGQIDAGRNLVSGLGIMERHCARW